VGRWELWFFTEFDAVCAYYNLQLEAILFLVLHLVVFMVAQMGLLLCVSMCVI
jgi:hypothetical protein